MEKREKLRLLLPNFPPFHLEFQRKPQSRFSRVPGPLRTPTWASPEEVPVAVNSRQLGLRRREGGYRGGYRTWGTAGSWMWGSKSCCAKDDSVCSRPRRHETLTLGDAKAGVQPTSWDEPGTAAEVSSARNPGRKPRPLDAVSSRDSHNARGLGSLRTKPRAPPPDATRPRHHLCAGLVQLGPQHAGRCSPDRAGPPFRVSPGTSLSSGRVVSERRPSV